MDEARTGADAATQAARQDLYRRMASESLAPLWEVLHTLTAPTPVTPAQPAFWDYARARAFLMEAGGLITAREAIRRVLILENPGLPGGSAVTQSLYAGLQLILPGEIAPTHRHTQSALRLVLEGVGAHTSVDGERVTMRPGDFVITPSWAWHEHGNPTDDPVIWLDGLDIRIVQLFGAQFCEETGSEAEAPPARREGSSEARFGRHLKPVGAASPFGAGSPLFSYPFDRSRESLARYAAESAPDPCHGWKMQFLNPLTGGHAMPSIAAFIQLLPAGFAGEAYRATDGTVFAALEGRGIATVGDERFAFGPRDVFVVPSWSSLRLEAREDAVLFSFSDRPGQEALGLWRERRG